MCCAALVHDGTVPHAPGGLRSLHPVPADRQIGTPPNIDPCRLATFVPFPQAHAPPAPQTRAPLIALCRCLSVAEIADCLARTILSAPLSAWLLCRVVAACGGERRRAGREGQPAARRTHRRRSVLFMNIFLPLCSHLASPSPASCSLREFRCSRAIVCWLIGCAFMTATAPRTTI